MMKTEPDVLNRIMQRAAAGGDVYEALFAFYGYLRRILPVDRMSLVQFDFDRLILRSVAQSSDTGCEKTNFQFHLPAEIVDLIQNESLPRAHTINEPEMDLIGKNIAVRFRLSDWSMMSIRIKDQAVVYGAIFFVTKGRNKYTENHTRLLTGLYDKHKWFLEAVIKDHDETSAGPGQKEPIPGKYEYFRQVTRRLCGHLDLEAGVLHCLQYLSRFMPVATLAVHKHYTGPGDDFIGVSPNGFFDYFNPEFMTRSTEHLSPSGKTDNPKVTIINQPERNPAMKHNVKLFGPNWSAITMFLQHNRDPLGMASIITEGENAYTEEHRRLFAMLHDPFALALSNYNKHHEIIQLKNIIEEEKKDLQEELKRSGAYTIIGENSGLKSVMENARLVAGQDSPVLLTGETGSGKEIIANYIHQQSSRKDGPLIKVNCGAIPDTLLDSELFGHEKGAFTGAENRKIGRFERADRGTIFLDEIAELSLPAQVRMLRVLQYKVIERVGGTEAIPVDVRIIAATHRNLEAQTASGQFREDLWFRLNVFPIRIPPLRSRKADMPDLVNYFIEKKSRELKRQDPPPLSPDAMERLSAYEWPGNVRELENVVERELILSRGEVLTFQSITPGPSKGSSPDTAISAEDFLKMDEVYVRHIEKVLAYTNGKVSGPGGAAELLKINPATLRNRMKKLGIPYGWEKEKTT